MCKINIIYVLIYIGTISSFNKLSILAINDDVQKSPIVNIKDLGIIIGSITTTAWTNQTIYQFLGIPYAESPSGTLRFKPPMPRKAWNNTYDATKYGRRCPDLLTLKSDRMPNDPEDCLNLSVFTKNITAKIPVVVYIHGGGFYNGSASDHPPQFYLEGEIVLVVLQYRIGPLGWLSTRSEKIPGNAAIHDIILALRWVQKYINYFGGDPNQVTISSQSAGSAMSSLLVISPFTPDGLFHRVIMQSGSILASWAFNKNPLENAVLVCSKATECLDCTSTDRVNDCLMQLPVERLLDVYHQLAISPTTTTQDFYNILPSSPSELISKYTRKYPIMGGVTKDDGSFVLALIYDGVKKKNESFSNMTPRQFIDSIVQSTKEDDPTGLIRNMAKRLLFTKAQLNANDFHALIPGLFDLTGMITMKSPLFNFIRINAINNQYPSYLYTFDYEGQNTRFGYEFGNDWYPFNGGVHHSNDNIYLFNTHNLNEVDTKIAKKMVQLWTSFARTGQPQTDEKTIPAFTNEVGPYFHINKQITFGDDFLDELTAAVNDPDSEKLIRPNVEF